MMRRKIGYRPAHGQGTFLLPGGEQQVRRVLFQCLQRLTEGLRRLNLRHMRAAALLGCLQRDTRQTIAAAVLASTRHAARHLHGPQRPYTQLGGLLHNPFQLVRLGQALNQRDLCTRLRRGEGRKHARLAGTVVHHFQLSAPQRLAVQQHNLLAGAQTQHARGMRAFLRGKHGCLSCRRGGFHIKTMHHAASFLSARATHSPFSRRSATT